MIGSPLASLYVPVPSSSHGSAFRSGQPRLIVLHSLESPMRRGIAAELARGWMQSAGVSVHYIVDPGAVVQCLDEAFVGYGAGSVNPAAIHIEQAGRAAFSRADWTTADGLDLITRTGRLVGEIARRRGIPLRLATDAQVREAWQGNGPGGITTHDQCRRVIGGTTHTDPGPGYPLDLMMTAATGASAEGSRPQEDDMPYSEADLMRIVGAAVRATLDSITLDVTNYAAAPPEPRPGYSLLDTIRDTHNYASGAAGNVGRESARTRAEIAAAAPDIARSVVASLPAGAQITADDLAAALLRQIKAAS